MLTRTLTPREIWSEFTSIQFQEKIVLGAMVCTGMAVIAIIASIPGTTFGPLYCSVLMYVSVGATALAGLLTCIVLITFPASAAVFILTGDGRSGDYWTIGTTIAIAGATVFIYLASTQGSECCLPL